MNFPEKIPYLRTITLAWGLFGLVWITFEGSLGSVITMGGSSTAVLFLHLLQRQSGRIFARVWQWVSLTTVIGIVFGLTAVGITLLFMAVKTGLHAHGPEFSPEEIGWLIQQLPNWTIIGAFLGAGLGLISAGMRRTA